MMSGASAFVSGRGLGVKRPVVRSKNIRASLIRQEDSIIFALIERAQFARNSAVYESNAIPVPGFDRDGRRYSLLEYVIRETEQLHGKVRRYTSPQEHPFYPDDLPVLVLPPIAYPNELAPCAEGININPKILDLYLNTLLPEFTAPGDDFNYGSASTLDVLCLQALSKRIHYGKFVAEAKFREAPDEYSALIKAHDSEAIMERLTDRKVEQKVIERVRLKAATFGKDLSVPANGNGEVVYKVEPELIARLYDEWVMPLTKEVEVLYLLRRLQDQ